MIDTYRDLPELVSGFLFYLTCARVESFGGLYHTVFDYTRDGRHNGCFTTQKGSVAENNSSLARRDSFTRCCFDDSSETLGQREYLDM